MAEILGYDFILHAIIAGVLVSITAGIIGSLIVVNNMVFLAGGIAHAAYGGVGIAIFFSLPIMITTSVFTLIISIILALITLKERHRSDSAIAFIWAVGMALGIILVDLTPGYQSDFMGYLFGSILAVKESDLYIMGALLLLIVGILLKYYRDFLALSYDMEFAKLRGVNVKIVYITMLVLAGLTVVMAIEVVGLIMVIALLSIPTYIAEKLSKTLAQMMIISGILASVFTLLGLYISYIYNITSGATIILVAAISLGVFLPINRYLKQSSR